MATGACNCEAADAIGGIRPWDQLQRRIAAGWDRRPVDLPLYGWRHDAVKGLYFGPRDPRA